MLRRKVLVLLTAGALLLMGTGTAYAWDLIHSKSGYGRVTLRAWTKNYNQVAFVADHAGTRVSVSITVDCQSGDYFSDTWKDGGTRFRFILRGLGNSGRCDHTFRVVAKKPLPRLDLAVYGRG